MKTADQAWMVIQHNNTELTKLRPSSGSTQHLASFNYSADAEQLAAIITRAERCEQELSYHCKKSRLLNTPGKPFLLRVSIPSSFTFLVSLTEHTADRTIRLFSN